MNPEASAPWYSAISVVLEWANSHQGAITAVATVVIALTGVATALLTRTLARENRLLRKAGAEPEVVAYLLPDTRYRSMVNLILANIGQGPARNVKFTVDADHKDFADHNVNIANKQSRTAISILPQGDRVVAFFGAGHELFKEPRLRAFRVNVEYENLRGDRRSGDFKLDVSQFDGVITIGAPAEHDVAEALKTLAKEVHRWTSSYGRLKVEIMSTEEQRRVPEEAREMARQRRERKDEDSESRP